MAATDSEFAMDLLPTFASIALVNLVAWITPGPNMIAVMSASLTRGRRAGLLTGLGLSAGATVWAGLAVVGVASLFDLFPHAVLALRMAGAGYLVWLGLKSLRAALGPGPGGHAAPAAPARAGSAFRTGLLVSLTNPKAALFFGSVLTAFVPAEATGGVLAAVVLLCSVLAVACHSITATVFSTDCAVGFFRRARRSIGMLFGLTFLGLGLAVACDSVRRP